MWFASQMPVVGIPINFLGTWVHELGHGIGAEISGGTFEHMIVSPDFSGRASTLITGPGSHIMVLLTGLLAPAIASFFLLIMVRGLGLSRAAIILLAAVLIISALIWAGDMFTGITALGVGVFMLLLAWKGPEIIRGFFAQLIAISFAVSAVASIDYFFMKGGSSGGRPAVSDTITLSQLMGIPHGILAVLITAFSMGILFFAFKISGGMWTKKRLKTESAQSRPSTKRPRLLR